jgi:hypothetical protein
MNSTTEALTRMSPVEFQNTDEVVKRLREQKDQIKVWFSNRKSSLKEIVTHSVGSNTFRAFHHMPQKPSVVFREWASHECENAGSHLKDIRTQADYDEWIKQLCERLNQAWKEIMGQEMPFGPRRKLPNLLLKEFVLWTGHSDALRARLIDWLHVPLDSYSLVAIRNCIHDPEIPRSATMKFVTGETMYNQIQAIIRGIASQATVPAIYFDNLVWNSPH